MYDEELDLRGIPCPANAAKASLRLGMMDKGQTLKVILDNGEPMENVPEALTDEGHLLLKTENIDDNCTALYVQVG